MEEEPSIPIRSEAPSVALPSLLAIFSSIGVGRFDIRITYAAASMRLLWQLTSFRPVSLYSKSLQGHFVAGPRRIGLAFLQPVFDLFATALHVIDVMQEATGTTE